jgi:Na+-translocating ferredoxin:NAD+ oxidoreductase RnfG subunit
MKTTISKTCLMLTLLLFTCSIGIVPAVYAEQTIEQTQAQAQTLAFIEDVLPIDLTKYEVTTKILDIQIPVGGKQQQTVRYTLASAEGNVSISATSKIIA